MEQIIRITEFIGESLLHIWPYLLITIPISVLVKLTDLSKYIKLVIGKRPFVSILLATLIGSFSPLCSCGVIPLIASLLLGGVPLAPVMSFWIASPSMDPEIFFLSVSSLGWDLAIWRLVATIILSLMAGFITHFLDKKGLLGSNYLKMPASSQSNNLFPSMSRFGNFFLLLIERLKLVFTRIVVVNSSISNSSEGCCSIQLQAKQQGQCDCNSDTEKAEVEEILKEPLFKLVISESWKSTVLVVKYMSIAFLINALIMLYIPGDFLTGSIASNNKFSILIASFTGIMAYTNNITALALIGGFLKLGMSPAAALSFLLAGPVTSIPAMVAVKGLTNGRIFLLYLSLSLFGAILAGYAYQMASMLGL